MQEQEHREQTIRRFRELAERSERTGCFVFSTFHSPAGAALAYQAAAEPQVSLWGGAEGCERVVVRFGDPEALGYEEAYPIAVLRIEPKQQKFADALTHRDFLGAILGTGIKREVVGDILLREHVAYAFLLEEIAAYVAETLDQVKHTSVRCSITNELPEDARPQRIEERITVASPRLDATIARLYHLSRSEAKALFDRDLVFQDGHPCAGSETVPPAGAVISVRGHGKFIYHGPEGTNRKGRQVILVERYC